MPLPELVAARAKKSLDALCDRVPPEARHQVRLIHETKGNGITLIETRVPFDDPKGEWTRHKIAKLVFDPKVGEWTLYCFDRNGRRRGLPDVEPTRNLDQLLDELDRDRHALFWG